MTTLEGERCTTDGCPGDARYPAPGKGHIVGCTYPVGMVLGKLKDSKGVQATIERRTSSVTGGEKGVKPERMSLIPTPPLNLLARVYGFGEKKYAPHNYRKGYEWSKSYDALQRHLAAWWEREENDPESGLSHLGHAAFHVFALIVFSSEKRYAQFDDRYTTGPDLGPQEG